MRETSVIALRIDGARWTHWKTANVQRQVTALAGSFSFSLADPWQAKTGVKALPIATGMACEVLVDDRPVITGYVGKSTPFFTTTSHGITIAGRDKSADIADCAAIHTPGEWHNITVLHLARILAEPFGVPVTAAGDIGAPLPKFKLEPGEKAAEALFRALQMRELLATPTGDGGIVLSKIGSKRSGTVISEQNAKEASAPFDEDQRFSHYLVQGQQPGNDMVFGEAAASVSALVRDMAITRYRPFLVRAEDSVDTASARRRAEWEKTVRAASSVSLPVTLKGFYQDNGDLWDVNVLVPVSLPFFSISQEMLVGTVDFSQSIESGSITRLTLKEPKSYMQEPQKKAQSDGSTTSGTYSIEKEDMLIASRDRAVSEHQAISKGAV